jgi:hypothetical protein
MKANKFLLAIGLVALTVAGCAIRKDLDTSDFHPVNKPITDDSVGTSDASNGTKYCQPTKDGRFDEAPVNLQSGTSPAGLAWAEGGGCILRPIREVWAALNNLEAMRFIDTDRFIYDRTVNPNSQFTHLYNITYYKDTVIGPIEFTLQWYHGVAKGTFEAPEQITIPYQRVRGTSMIPTWHGGIDLTRVSNTVTSIAIRNDFVSRALSTSMNLTKARDALTEMIGHARTAQPDWQRLNAGLKDNPSAADVAVSNKPKASRAFCIKDSSGHYPSETDIATGAVGFVSWIKVRVCLAISSEAVSQAVKDPTGIHWQNAGSAAIVPPVASAAAGGAPVKTLAVSYRRGRFLRSAIQWSMNWEYDFTPATSGNRASLVVSYKIDPATTEFPVWNGKLSVTEVEPGVSEIEIENRFLSDVVSDSPDLNKSLTLGLLSDLTAAANPR